MDAPHLRLGRIGEEIAVRHLRRGGVEVLARNWRCAAGDVRGEVDVVGRDGTDLVVVEVKTRRRSDAGEPLVAVTAAKQRRLRALACALVADGAHARAGTCRIRFDVVAVSWSPSGGGAEIVHLRGAF